MIQLTHLGRRTRWDKGDWLPAVTPSHKRESAHRAFVKKVEDWDITRIITDYANAAERMQAGGMDGIELEVFGHLQEQFISPLTNTLEVPYGGTLENRMRFSKEVLRAIRPCVGATYCLDRIYSTGEALCIHNAATGRKLTMPHDIPPAKTH